MSTGPSRQTYSATAKAYHWLIALLVLAQFVVAMLMPDIGPDTKPETVIELHFSLGVVILVIMVLRLVRRLMHPVALEMSNSPSWERAAAHATHRAFYLLLLVGPFLGWASASAHGLAVRLFGLTLPALATLHAHWGLVAGDLHMLLMWAVLGLIVLHAGAALFHHAVRHDGVLRRMLP